MPGYVTKALQRLQHSPEKQPQYAPHACAPIIYGQRSQQKTEPDTSPLLDKKGTTHVQSISGSFLYYARAIEHSILPALSEISYTQAEPTQLTKKKCIRLMDFLTTNPDAYIRFHASDMVLHVDSDAAYLVAPKAKSRIAGYFYLSDHPNLNNQPKLNGPVLVECKTLKHVVSSAAEAEVIGIFYNAGVAITIRHFLNALGHKQPPTPIKTDNSTATGFVYDNIRQRRTKTWDMRYYWLRDRLVQKMINIFWDKGSNNHADYWTKHHPAAHHRNTRNKYIQDR